MKEPKDKRTKEYKIWKANQALTKGLGDLVEDIIPPGIKEWFRGKDCGCDKRKEKLNLIKLPHRYKVLRCFTEEQYHRYKEYTERRTLTFQTKDIKLLTGLFAWVFAIQYNPVDLCSNCQGSYKILTKIQRKLDIVFESYE